MSSVPSGQEAPGNEAELHRYCRRCRRPLKSPESMKVGYGPVCLRKEQARLAQSENLGRGVPEMAATTSARKICPFMSFRGAVKPEGEDIFGPEETYCSGSKCMAWNEERKGRLMLLSCRANLERLENDLGFGPEGWFE